MNVYVVDIYILPTLSLARNICLLNTYTSITYLLPYQKLNLHNSEIKVNTLFCTIIIYYYKQ